MVDDTLVPEIQILGLIVGSMGLLSVAVRFIVERRPYGELFFLFVAYGVVFVTSLLGLLLEG